MGKAAVKPKREKPISVYPLPLYAADCGILRSIQLQATTKFKGATIRMVLRKYWQLLEMQRLAAKRGAHLRLVEVQDSGDAPQQVLHAVLDLEV